uniref:Uncharacterized protein n=1 Tax=viral metagenome TaxID=1070528 RepID=A0A6M3JNU5_9ZZZZ
MTQYEIVRVFLTGRKRVVARGLTLEQAQKHCQDPQTSSYTCTSARGRRRTREQGPWFDTYTED